MNRTKRTYRRGIIYVNLLSWNTHIIGILCTENGIAAATAAVITTSSEWVCVCVHNISIYETQSCCGVCYLLLFYHQVIRVIASRHSTSAHAIQRRFALHFVFLSFFLCSARSLQSPHWCCCYCGFELLLFFFFLLFLWLLLLLLLLVIACCCRTHSVLRECVYTRYMCIISFYKMKCGSTEINR